MIDGVQCPAVVAAKGGITARIVGLIQPRRLDEDPIQLVPPYRSETPLQLLGRLEALIGAFVAIGQPAAVPPGMLAVTAKIEGVVVVKTEFFKRREKLRLRIVAQQGNAFFRWIVHLARESYQ